MEQFANNADSTLNGAINNVTTTIVVADGTPFPSVGDFRLIIGSDPDTAELVRVTARSGNTLTVVRGQEGTVAQSWGNGTTVTHIVTAAALVSLRDFLKGKTLDSSLETISGAQDGYALTWSNTDGYWAARPGSPFTAVGNELYTTRSLSVDANGTVASSHGTAKLYVNGSVQSSGPFSIGEIPFTTRGFGFVSNAVQTFTVPANVTSMLVKMWGPGGGSGNFSGNGGGGAGGYTTGLLSVTPGETLYLVVGSGGKAPASPSSNGGNGGWPGGGFGTRGDASGGGGGGYTGIFTASTPTQGTALAIAGGGGGGTGFGNFGAGGGGGLNGGSRSGTSGKGASQVAGGLNGNGTSASTTIAAGSNNIVLVSTTIASGSNGSSLPQGTINVASTTGFSASGTILVNTSSGQQTVTYTGLTATTFTGCTGGSGTMSTGGIVSVSTTINVASAAAFPTSGVLLVFTSNGAQILNYTGKTATTFTGCTGGTGTMSTGGSVLLGSAGSALMGGVAYGDQTVSQTNDCGGGGSGYFGGGAGQGDGASGGGGSGFLHATRMTLASTTAGNNAASGNVANPPPSNTDPAYVAGVGIGASPGNAGGDGYLVFQWGGQVTVGTTSVTLPNRGAFTASNFDVSITSDGYISLVPTTTLSLSGTTTTLSGSTALNLSSSAGPISLTGNTNVSLTGTTGTASVSGATTLSLSAGTTATLSGTTDVRFNTAATLRGYFDNNGILRIGPSSSNTATLQGSSWPINATDYLWSYNSSGSNWAEIIAGGAANRAALQVWNNATSNTCGVSLFAAGTGHGTAEYAGNGTIEQSGNSTSALVFAKRNGTDGTSFASTGAIWQSGAWTIGRATNNDTSSEAQAGLTGPLINISSSTGTFNSTANQALIFNQSGALNLQGHTDVRFNVGSALRGYYDSNGVFRTGPSASTSASAFGISWPAAAVDTVFVHNASGNSYYTNWSGSASGAAGFLAYNTSAGSTSTIGLALGGAGLSHATPDLQGNAFIEQAGSATSALVFRKVQGNSSNFATTGRIYQTGAWTIGSGNQNDTSTEAQAGLTGPLVNISEATGSVSSVANQALLYNIAGVVSLQGHAGHNFVTGTTSIASTNTSKFITGVGRRLATVVKTASGSIQATEHVVLVGSISSSITLSLPAAPADGDTFIVKDQLGNAAAFGIIISGNGFNIDGQSTYTMNTNYESVTLVFASNNWSVI